MYLFQHRRRRRLFFSLVTAVIEKLWSDIQQMLIKTSPRARTFNNNQLDVPPLVENRRTHQRQHNRNITPPNPMSRNPPRPQPTPHRRNRHRRPHRRRTNITNPYIILRQLRHQVMLFNSLSTPIHQKPKRYFKESFKLGAPEIGGHHGHLSSQSSKTMVLDLVPSTR